MLLRLYLRWCEDKKFTVKELDIYLTEQGIKMVLLEVLGDYAYGYLRTETGVHRLVRLSPFDSSNRRHTTFASVHAYPVLDDTINIDIRPDDIRVDTYRSSGAGGQHVNKTDSAVRITHLKTGIVAQCQNERSQIKNKQVAMNILKSRLYDHYEREKKSRIEKESEKKADIAWGHQIRSYVLHPYNLVKDHRTNKESNDPQKVLDGGIDDFIEAYLEKNI
ncbi:peptide chain release factor 2-like [Ylistrum balloti]|uniref:peptide chain release factor 2-like n=1 Tax=Ylistrum balloti TaxID=509963 RepID=UPI002905B77C|nr:peptide chain release factor 2-like [Ylistrum balloti]